LANGAAGATRLKIRICGGEDILIIASKSSGFAVILNTFLICTLAIVRERDWFWSVAVLESQKYRQKALELCKRANSVRVHALKTEYEALAFSYMRLAEDADRDATEGETKPGSWSAGFADNRQGDQDTSCASPPTATSR
jgi:hypothetical protein